MQHDMGEYNKLLVILSIIVSIASSYTAFDMIERTLTRGTKSIPWMLITSFVMGTGIWSVHFIGMLAFQTDIPVNYELPLLFVSVVLPILASFAALLLITPKHVRKHYIIWGGLFIGIAIISMHYTGMMSMKMPAAMTYELFPFIMSLFIAFGISYFSLYFSFELKAKRLRNSPLGKSLGAVLMGVAIAGMHYTGMSAVNFNLMKEVVSGGHPSDIDDSLLAVLVGFTVLFILTVILAGLFVDRQRALRSAQMSERRYITLFEHSPDMVLCMNSKDGSIVSANPSFFAVTGYSIEELMSRPRSAMLYSEKDLQKIRACFEKAVSGEPQKVECSIRHRSGREVILSTTMFPLFFEKQSYVYTISKEITEQKMAERELVRAKEEAESVARIKSEFLAMMSHEIRTPLNGIIGINELLLESDLEDDQKELLQIQHKSSYSLLKVINDMLEFSKIEAGKIIAANEKFHLHSSIEECFDLIAVIAQSKQLKMEYHIDPQIPAQLIGDPERLRQILINLIGNAVKFTEIGSVRLEVILCSKEMDRYLLEFMLIDTGIGIRPDLMDKLFVPFSQLDSSMNRMFEGTGLGLAICKKLVEQMGGQIWAVRGLEKGAAFGFKVPFKTAVDADFRTMKESEITS